MKYNKNYEKGHGVLFIPITAQPPTFGTVLSIMTIIDNFDKIIICVQDNPILLKTQIVIQMLQIVFPEPKFEIITRTEDFTLINDLPDDLPEFDYIGTINERIYSNLTIKNIPCILLPRSIGYDEMFHRNAFRQSEQLELLRMKTNLLSTQDLKEKTPNKMAGGEK